MKLAVLVGCQLEPGYQNFFKIFDKQFPIDYDIFIYTNKLCHKYINYFDSKKIKKCKFVEDDEHIKTIEKNLEEDVRKNQRIFQWLKLKRCYELLEDYQKENNIKYDYVYKVRMPKNRKDKNQPFNMPNLIQEDEIYCTSDMYFVARNETMKKVCKLYDDLHTLLYGYDNNKKYWIINYDILLESNFNAAAFILLNYPHKYISDKNRWNAINVNNPNLLKQLIQQNIDNLRDYTYVEGDNLITSHRGCPSRPFRSEKSFAYYINYLGLKARLLNH